MKNGVKYSILSDTMYRTTAGLMEVRVQNVEFVKHVKGSVAIHYKARIIEDKDTEPFLLLDGRTQIN